MTEKVEKFLKKILISINHPHPVLLYSNSDQMVIDGSFSRKVIQRKFDKFFKEPRYSVAELEKIFRNKNMSFHSLGWLEENPKKAEEILCK